MNGSGLDRVTVTHANGAIALDQVTLLAEAGELVVVLGPSGGGKTTLLRTIAGLTELKSGEVYIGGRAVSTIPTEERNVAMVFESAQLMPTLDVAHNLSFSLRLRGLPEPDIDGRVSTSARGLRLTKLLSRFPRTLSSGERGQAGVGRALVRTPSVYLLDEPLAHLDAAERWRMRRYIADAVRSEATTTFYATHDQSEALAIADRIAVLDRGHVLQVAAPRDVYARPASLLVADLVGSVPIGLLPARLVGAGQGFQVGARTLALWGPVPASVSSLAGRPLVLGLRAESVTDGASSPDPRLARLTGIALLVEQLGAHAIVTVGLAAAAVTTPGASGSLVGAGSAVLRARFPAGTQIEMGTRVEIAFDVADAHVFDAITGQALAHPDDYAPSNQ